MSKNMPILYQNIMSGLPSDFSRDVFLWAVGQFQDDRHAYKAEAFAREADRVRETAGHLISMRQLTTLRNGGMLLSEDQQGNLLRFIQIRHANFRLGGNKKPNFAN